MRSVLLLILGLVVGAVGAAKVSNVLHMRSAYPDGVMSVMQHHLGTLAQSMRQGKCPAQATRWHLQRLQAMQPDIVPAFAGDVGTKPDFRKHAQKLDTAIQSALAAAPADCPALNKAVSNIGGACKSCHEIYR
jgi:cytochrome c556